MYNQELYDRVIQHLADTRLFEMETQSNNSKTIHRHQGRVRDLLKRNIKAELAPEVSRTMKELNSITTNAVSDYSSAAITFNTNNLHKSVGGFFSVSKPSGIDMLKEIVGPNIETSRTLTEHFNRIGSGELIRIQGIIGRGLAEGTSHKDIIDSVIATTTISEHQARSLVRTSITRTQAVAIDKVMTDNSDVVKGFRFTAVLDARTSAICSSHDGHVYPLSETKWRPPLHWNCRSSLVPVLYAKADLKKNASPKINQAALDAVPANKLTGEASATEDYSGWLTRQPMDVQLKHLGSEEKVSLFQQGHLSVKEFFTRAGNELSISALRRLDNIRTSIFPIRQAALSANVEGALTVSASKPYDLLRSVKAQEELRAMYINDANSMNQALSLTDFKGTSLVGKRTSRVRSNNEFDERNTSFDPFTGEQRSTLLYDPDYSVYQERLDFLKNSKALTADQKTFIAEFANSLEDKVSLNQQSVVVENLRVIFERYTRDKRPWDSFMNVARGESQYSVVNVSRILDRRSRDRAALFDQYMIGEDPKVQIFGEYYSFDDISENILKNQRYVDSWSSSIGREKAREAYYSDTTPLRQFLFNPKKEPKSYASRLKKWAEKEIPGYKLYKDWDKPTESTLEKIRRTQRERYRNIVDLEFIYSKERSNYITRFIAKKFFGSTYDQDFLNGLAEGTFNDAKGIDVFAKVMGLIADGKSTDYDSLAINIGKNINKEWRPLFPFQGVTMEDHHEAGSRILKALTDQKKIRVISRGKVRRSAIDIDTGRPSGAWKETVSREVSILDQDMLELQRRNRQVIIAQRLGVVRPRDQLYVKPGEKTYFDARGANTGQSIITRRASGNYDKLIVDRDFADMLNHTMNVEYQVDQEFASFIDDVVRFRDPRGNVKKYDELNDFRKLILQRGDQGFGFMQTVKWHLQRNKPFKVIAQIDGRGRVYYQGYLTPTGGEVVRPFLNSGVSRQFGATELRELAIQLGSMIGPATEALTQAGRFAIFQRSEKDILELGNLLLSKTQRDANIRKFLENHLIREHDAEGIPKIARMALEYARIHKHVGGDFTDFKKFKPYMTRLMIENDASSSGAQIIGLSTGDRPIAINSNVLATEKKNRLYDLVAMDTASDPEFQNIKALSGASIEWTDLAKAAKSQNMVSLKELRPMVVTL